MEFHGTSQNSLEFHGLLWNSMEFHGSPMHFQVSSMEFYRVPWTLHGVLRSSMETSWTCEEFRGIIMEFPWNFQGIFADIPWEL